MQEESYKNTPICKILKQIWMQEVYFLFYPASKLSGDHEGDVAKWKGEVEAINTAQEKLKCK